MNVSSDTAGVQYEIAEKLMKTTLPILLIIVPFMTLNNVLTGVPIQMQLPSIFILVFLIICFWLTRKNSALTAARVFTILIFTTIVINGLVWCSFRTVSALLGLSSAIIWSVYFLPMRITLLLFVLMMIFNGGLTAAILNGTITEHRLASPLSGYFGSLLFFLFQLVTAAAPIRLLIENVQQSRIDRDKLTKSYQDIQESRSFTVQAVNNSHQLFGWLTPDGTLQFANQTALSMINADMESVTGKLFWNTPWFAYSEEAQSKLKSAVYAAAAGTAVQYEAVHPDSAGKMHVVDFHLQPIRSEAGEITMIVAESSDITERKIAENALKSLSTSYAHLCGRDFYEAITAHIAQQFSIDYLFVGKLNPQDHSITVLGGYGKGAPMGDLTYSLQDTPCANVMDRDTCIYPKDICSIYPNDLLLQEMAIEGYAGSMVRGKGGEPIGIIVALNCRPLTETGHLTDMFNIFLDRVSAEMQRGIAELALEQELAVKEKLRDQLHQSQKMEAIGQLAGGVAHDFNNALAGIIGAAEMIKIGELSDGEEREYIDMILSAGERAADLTKKLLTFSRKGTKVSTAVDLLAIVNDTAALLKHTINKNITVQVDNRAVQCSVIGDDSLLQNALMNMGINAGHAMPDGGTLTFTLENLELDAEYCEVSPFEIIPGEYLEIAVRDTGTGMSPEVQSRIFEPFFTTKELGQGTGLGLASVYGMVKEHGGAITVYSELGTGTIFRIYLPVTAETVRRYVESETPVLGSGTILVIDDEELIRITAAAMLRTMGYRVIPAANGQEGVEIFREAHDEIDLIILDMIMPVMSGREAFALLREISPQIPIIIASGFAKEEDMAEMKKQGVNGFLNKPFRKAELAGKIADTIMK